jgi:hypothetical protein
LFTLILALKRASPFRMFDFRFILVVYSQLKCLAISNMKSIYILISFFTLLAVNSARGVQRDTAYKRGDFLVVVGDTTKIDFIIKGEPHEKIISKGDTISENEKYLILGDDDKTVIRGVYKKYRSKYKFSKFRTIVYTGKLASPIFKTDRTSYYFRTQIRSQCKSEGVNFAGHYTIVKWGCGSPCQTVAIVDRVNGKIYYSSLPQINNEIAYGLKCRRNSRMLILNSDLLDEYKGYVNCSTIVKVETIEWAHNKTRVLPE